MSVKRFKDPIYGYIHINSSVITDVIDTPEFQRLRDIVQTSYEPLYSSAVHNRFVHSIGVYHLGTIVTGCLRESIKEKRYKIKNYDRYLELFELACLLHDIGHAPFSHTGEEFYLNNGSRDQLHRKIVGLTNDKYLEKEIASKNYKAAPHELMSVIVSLVNFENFFDDDLERSFFARCILGYSYSVNLNKHKSFLNCLISVLNSSVIDVDKLDYLIRDAFISGFDTVSLDYVRLLTQIRIICNDNDIYRLVYEKGAISVIENVVYAHDAERKWIQTHPVVQYESYLIQTAMQKINKKYENVGVFSQEALSKHGVELFKDYHISLLSDGDVIFLMKNLNDECVAEYFDRRMRRHPLWKSESEYKAVFSQGCDNEDLRAIEEGLESVCRLCETRVLDSVALKICKEDIEKTKKLIEKKKLDKNPNWLLTIKNKKKCVRWLEALEAFASDQNIAFDFVVLNTKQFNSGFAKSEFGKIEIIFDSMDSPCCFEKVTNVLKADNSDRENYFYIYYRRNDDRKINLNKLAMELGKVALKEKTDSRMAEMNSGFGLNNR